MAKSIDAIRTDLQGAIDTGQLQGIRSDGVNTNPRTQESARSVGSKLSGSVSTINSNALKPTPVVNPPALPTPPVNTRINATTDQPLTPVIPESTPEPTTLKDQTQAFLQDQMGGGGKIDTQAVRDELRLNEKRQAAIDVENELLQTKQRYQNQIDDLEKNEQGNFGGALAGRINQLTQEANKDLANIAIRAKVANDDFNGAQNIYNQRVADMKDYRDYQFQVYNATRDALQNDLTASEKLTLDQNFRIQQDETDFEQQKELADYNAQIDRSNAVFESELKAKEINNNSVNIPISETKYDNNLSFEGFITQKENEQSMSLSPATRDSLRTEYEALVKNQPPTNQEAQSIVGIASNLLGSERAKSSKANLTSAFNNGDYQSVYTQIANNVEDTLTGEVKTKFANSRTDIGIMSGMRDAILQYTNGGGDIGILKGTADDISKKLGQLSQDPEFSALATQLEREFQTYRLNMTGAAFSPEESREYAAVNPRADASLELNLATIDGALAQLENRVTSTINARVPGATKIYAQIQSEVSEPEDLSVDISDLDFKF